MRNKAKHLNRRGRSLATAPTKVGQSCRFALISTMASEATTAPRHQWCRHQVASERRAFTLVELILVMAVLVIAVSLVTPTMSKFFQGRALDSEVRRFVSLTHYGQSRAVSEGVPMMLWIDERKQTYGLKQEPGYSEGTDAKAVEFGMGKGLKIAVAAGAPAAPLANSQTGRILNNQAGHSSSLLPAIHFSPEGAIMRGTSIMGVSIQETNHPAVWIGQSADRLSYEVQDQNTVLANSQHH